MSEFEYPEDQNSCWEWEGVTHISGVSKMVFLPKSLVDGLVVKTGNANLRESAYFIPDVTKEPGGIFQGLRDGLENAYCYSGIPNGNFTQHLGVDVQLTEGHTFVVYLTPDYRVFEWTWVRSDADNPHYPVNWKTRFTKGKLWPAD